MKIQPFIFPEAMQSRRFYNLLHNTRATKADGIHRSVFFSKTLPVGSAIIPAEPVFISSHFSYAFLNSGELTVGVLFMTPSHNTTMDGSRLVVSVSDTPCKKYRPNYSLESFGLLISVGDGGTILVVPRTVSSPLLVEVQ